MTKEISKDVRAKVFAQHIGNNVSYAYLLGDREHFTTGKLVGVYLDSEGYWMLKCLDFNGNIIEVDIDEGQARLEMLDLSDISDEDIDTIAKSYGGVRGICDDGFLQVIDKNNFIVRYFILHHEIPYTLADFLRSRSYMLPAFGITDLFEAGIAVRKNKEV